MFFCMLPQPFLIISIQKNKHLESNGPLLYDMLGPICYILKWFCDEGDWPRILENSDSLFLILAGGNVHPVTSVVCSFPTFTSQAISGRCPVI